MKPVLALTLAALTAALAPAAVAKTNASPAAAKPLGYKLADRVLNQKRLPSGVKAAQEILALSGVPTVREGQEIVPGVAPLTRWKVTARETVLMTLGARNPQVSLSTMGRMLSKAGVDLGGRDANEAFPDMVRDWLFAASMDPTLPLNQPATFVTWMQTRQRSRTDLFTRTQEPDKMVVSSLEAKVILANLARVIKPGAPPDDSPPQGDNEDIDECNEFDCEEPVGPEEEAFRATAAQGGTGPCGSVKAAFESLGPIASGAADIVIGDATGSAIESYADSLADEGGDRVGEVMTALDIADRVWRTYAFSQHIQVIVLPAIVTGDNFRLIKGRVHKPTDGSRRHVWYVAGVGLDDEGRAAAEQSLKLAKDQPFQESMRACAELHGITIPKSPYAGLAEEMTKWSAYWTPHFNTDEVRWYPPRREKKLRRLDEFSAWTAFKVGIKWEDRRDHKDGIEVKSDWNATVEIAAQKPPSPDKLVKLAIAIGTFGVTAEDHGEFAGPIAEFSESLFRAVFKPKATGAIPVEEHIENPCKGLSGSNRAQSSC